MLGKEFRLCVRLSGVVELYNKSLWFGVAQGGLPRRIRVCLRKSRFLSYRLKWFIYIERFQTMGSNDHFCAVNLFIIYLRPIWIIF